MLWSLVRSSPPVLWKASLLASLISHAILAVVMLLLWPDGEKLSQNVIPVELVTLPRTAGIEPRPVDVTPPPPTEKPARRDEPVPPAVVTSQPSVQQPASKSPRRAADHKQPEAPSSPPDKVGPGSHAIMAASPEPAQEEQIIPLIGPQGDNAATDITSSAPPPVASELDSVRAAYLQTIGTLIDRQKSYPLLARKGRQQGVVQMVFILNQDGTLDHCLVKESSGFRLLDKAALKAIRGVQRYPRPPAALGEKPSFQIAISFLLDD